LFLNAIIRTKFVKLTLVASLCRREVTKAMSGTKCLGPCWEVVKEVERFVPATIKVLELCCRSPRCVANVRSTTLKGLRYSS
jgi:hypothetical protein